jgi:hypothetical protein
MRDCRRNRRALPGQNLELDAKARKFDVADANQFLTREYRKGWEVPGLG